MDERTKNNRELGILWFQNLNDSAGYPNGFPYWHEMSTSDQYHYCAEAIGFLDILSTLATVNLSYGFGDRPRYGEGLCKELFDYLEEMKPQDKAEFDFKIEHLRKQGLIS